MPLCTPWDGSDLIIIIGNIFQRYKCTNGSADIETRKHRCSDFIFLVIREAHRKHWGKDRMKHLVELRKHMLRNQTAKQTENWVISLRRKIDCWTFAHDESGHMIRLVVERIHVALDTNIKRCAVQVAVDLTQLTPYLLKQTIEQNCCSHFSTPQVKSITGYSGMMNPDIMVCLVVERTHVALDKYQALHYTSRCWFDPASAY